MQLSDPSPAVFSALLSGNIKQLCNCSQNELRPFLPCLARMVLCSSRLAPVSMVTETSVPSDKSLWEGRRKAVFALIAGMEEVNAISKYLAVDFHVSLFYSQPTSRCVKHIFHYGVTVKEMRRGNDKM